MNFWQKFRLRIKSRTSLIWIRTKEEERLEKLLIFQVKGIIKGMSVGIAVSGIKGLVNENGKFSNNPLGVLNWLNDQTMFTLLLVKDFHKFYEDPSISRTLRNFLHP